MRKLLFSFLAVVWSIAPLTALDTATEVYRIDFTSGQGDWTIDNVTLDGLSRVWQHSTYEDNSFMKASAYKNNTPYTAESWLISPVIDLSEAATATLSVRQAMKFGKDGMYVRMTADGKDWKDVSVSPTPSGNSWTFVTSTADVSAFAGEAKVQIAFIYTSTSAAAPTWEVQWVSLTTTGKPVEQPCRYEGLEGYSSAELLQRLHSAIAEHTTLSYDNIRADRAKVDILDDGTVDDIYAGCSFYPSDYCHSVTDVPDCSCYNREHSLPKSWWGGSQDEPMYTDLHYVIPTDYNANTKRSAWVYDEVNSATWTNSFGSKLGTSKTWGDRETAFEPVNEYKGDIARTYFYMLTCYLDKNFKQGGKGYRYFTYSNSTAGFTASALSLLLKWHRQDPVSEREITRNEKVAKKQGNRNPFVDDPNLVEYIWGTMKGKGYECNGEVENPDSTVVEGSITCTEARSLALALAKGSQSSDEYIVVGYVTSAQSYDNSYHSQSYWMADEQNGGQVFYAFQCKHPDEEVEVGYKVAVTGNLLNYNGTPEMKWGQTRILSRDIGSAVGTIRISDVHGNDVHIYTLTGEEVTAQKDNLPSGIYIVQTPAMTQKVLVW